MGEAADKSYAKVVARAWSDPEYKARLQSDPHGALREMGMDPGANVTIKVMENTADTVYLVLPRKPAEAHELSDEQLAEVAGGINQVPEIY